MPILVLKTQGGISYPLDNGKSLTLRGYGLINKVDSSVWKECKEKHKDTIQQMIEDGFLIVSDNENSATKNATDDTMQQALDKQNKAIENNKQDIVIEEGGRKRKIGRVGVKEG